MGSTAANINQTTNVFYSNAPIIGQSRRTAYSNVNNKKRPQSSSPFNFVKTGSAGVSGNYHN